MDSNTSLITRYYQNYLSFCTRYDLGLVLGDGRIPPFVLVQDIDNVLLPWFDAFDNHDYMRLGKRQERFFSLFLEHSTRYALLRENIQIRKDKITIGELDFLIEDVERKCYIHLELVNKLYVYDPSVGDTPLAHWIGPNRKDSLVQKLDRLESHQFPLFFRKETELALKHFGLKTHNFKQSICFKALLFVPMSEVDLDMFFVKNDEEQLALAQEVFCQDSESGSMPIGVLNRDCVRGVWMPMSAFTKALFVDYSFYLPKKHDWFLDPSYHTIWYSYDEIKAEISVFLQQYQSPLCWIKRGEEYLRFFVVWW